MTNYREKVNAEIENINQVLSLLSDNNVNNLSPLELAGTASILHSFYNGIENILKQSIISNGNSIPIGKSWHKQLLILAKDTIPLTNKLVKELLPYLAFRHFFSHAYVLDLDPNKIEPLLLNVRVVFNEFIELVIVKN